MADGISFDFSDMTKLAADLGEVPKETRAELRKALEVTSRNIKDAWKGKLTGSAMLPHLAGDISYDVTSANSSVADIEAEIGIDKSRVQGPAGNFSEFGTPKTAPRGYGLASLNENIPDFEKGVGIAAENGLKKANL